MIALAEKKLVHRRKAENVEVSDNLKSQIGIDNCKVAAYDKAKILRVNVKKGEPVHVMALHEACNEFCYVLSGEIELEVDGQTYKLTEDETILFDGMLDHRYTAIETSEFITVHIPKDEQVIRTLLAVKDAGCLV